MKSVQIRSFFWSVFGHFSCSDIDTKVTKNFTDAKFDQFNNAFSLLDKIWDGKISLADAKNDQAELKSNLNEIKIGNKKHRSKGRKNALHNIEMVYKARNSVIEFFDDYP